MTGIIRQDGGIAGNAVSGHMPSWASLPEGHSDIGRVKGDGEMPDFANPDSAITHTSTEGGEAKYSAPDTSTSFGTIPSSSSTMENTKPSVNSMGKTIIDI